MLPDNWEEIDIETMATLGGTSKRSASTASKGLRNTKYAEATILQPTE